MLVFDVYFHFEDYKAVRREMMTQSIPNREKWIKMIKVNEQKNR